MADNTINPGSGLQGDPSSSADFINAEDLGIDMDSVGPMASGYAFPSVDAEPEEEDASVDFDFDIDPVAAGLLDEDKAISYEDQYLIEDFADKLGSNGIFGINSGMMQDMAENQSISEQLGRATMRLANIPFNLVGSVANMLDFEDYFNSDDEMGNWLSELMTEITDDVNKSTGIYRRNPGQAFDMTDSGWWIENGSGLVNSIAEFVILGAATGGVGGAARFLTGLKKLSDGTKLARGFDALVSSGLLNQAESMKSAAEIYKSTRDKALEQGLSAQEANQIGADAAAHSVNLQRANILVNMTSAGRFLKPATTTRGAINKALESGKKKFGKDILTEAPQEYIEENINLIGEAEGNRLADALLADKKYEYNIENTISDVASLEGLEAGTLGMVGAIGQTGGTAAANRVKYKKRTKRDAAGNAIYSEKGKLAYIKQDAVDAVNNLYKAKETATPKQKYKATPLEKNGEKLGWIVEDGDKKVTVNKDDEALIAKYGIGQEAEVSGISSITKEDISKATGLAEGDPRLERLMKMHEKVVEKGLSSINDPKLRAEGKEFDVAEKKEVKEFYSLNKENKEKAAKLQTEFEKLNAEMEKSGISATDIMLSAKEQIAHQNELNLIDVLSDPTVYKSTPKRQAVIDKMKSYAENLEGKAKADYLNKIAKLDGATVEELEEFREEAKNRLLSTQVKQHAALGAVERLEELYTKVANLSPEKASEQGYAPSYKEDANKAIQKIKEYEKIYQKIAGRFGKDVDGVLFDSAVRTAELEKEIKSLARKKELADARRKFTGEDKLAERIKQSSKGKTAEQIDKEIEKQQDLIAEYKVRKAELGDKSKVDYDAKIQEAEQKIKDLEAEGVGETSDAARVDFNAIYGEASVNMSDYDDVVARLENAQKEYRNEIALQEQMKTPAGQAKYFTEKSTPQRSFERKRLVHNKLVEMYQEQFKEGDDRAIYFYQNKPVKLEPKEDSQSEFGYTFELLDVETGEVIRAVDEGGLKTLLQNTKSQAEYLKFVEDQRIAEVTKVKNDILKQVRKQGTEEIINIQKQQATTESQISEVKAAINTLTNAAVTEKLALETKFKDGSIRTDNYKFNAADNSITNLKTGKKLFGQSPLRTRLERQFQEDFETARESVVTNNAVIEQLEEQLEKYNTVYDTLNKQKNLIRDYQDILKNKENFLMDADVDFQQVFENAISDLKSSVGISVEDLTNKANRLEANQADLVQATDMIKNILDKAKVDDLNFLERNSLEVRLAKQQRLLRSVDRQVEEINQALEDYIKNEETVALMKHIDDMMTKADAAARKAAEKTKKEMGSANFPTKGSNPEPVTVDDLDFKKGNLARKLSAYTTAGNDLGDPTETSKRWFRALNLIGPNEIKNYRLEMMTREQAEARIAEDPAYATIFSEENKDYELYEYEDGKPVLDAAGKKILRETPYVGLRAVLIKKDGTLAKSDTAGKISNSGTLALSGYIHNPTGKTVVFKDEDGNLQSNLSVPHIIREHDNFKMNEEGMPYALSTIQGWLNSEGPVKVKGEMYDSGVDFQNKVLKDVYEDLQTFREDIFSTIEDGERAIVKIQELSGGHPIKEKRNFEGNRIEKSPGKTFTHVKNLMFMDVTPRGEVTVEDTRGRRLDLVPRLINENEVDAVLQILDHTLNSEQMRTKGTPASFTIDGKEHKVYPFNSDKYYTIMEQYIYWGKAQDGKNADYQIYFDKDTQRLHFGAEDSIPFSEIMTSEDLKKFLSTKRLNFNKTIAKKVKSSGVEKTPFYRMEFTNDGPKIQTYNGEGRMSGYENFIYQNFTTDLVDATEDRPNFAQRAIKFSKNLTDVEDTTPLTSEKKADTKEKAESVFTKQPTTENKEAELDEQVEQQEEKTPKQTVVNGSFTLDVLMGGEQTSENDPAYDLNTMKDAEGESQEADGKESLGSAQLKQSAKKQAGNLFSAKPLSAPEYVHDPELKSNEAQLRKAYNRVLKQMQGMKDVNPKETTFEAFAQAVKDKGGNLDIFFKEASPGNIGAVANAMAEGGDFDISTLADKDSTSEAAMFKLTPVQIVKLHNFIGENARLFKAKGLSLDPAVYEVEMKSTTNNVDTFIDVMKNYLNC